MSDSVLTRPALPADCQAMAAIYNQGIEERVATFETRLREAHELRAWLDGVHPCLVAERDGRVVGFACCSTYRPRECYAGVAEFSIYVAREARGLGVGRQVLQALMHSAAEAGIWKLVSRIFPENQRSRRLLAALGFREVGVYHRHARLDGVWRDVVIVEKLLGAAVTEL